MPHGASKCPPIRKCLYSGALPGGHFSRFCGVGMTFAPAFIRTYDYCETWFRQIEFVDSREIITLSSEHRRISRYNTLTVVAPSMVGRELCFNFWQSSKRITNCSPDRQ